MPADQPVAAPQNDRHLSGVTLFGAIGNCLAQPQYMLGPATDIVSFRKFLLQVVGALRNPYSAARPYLVLDNHPSHTSPKMREELHARFHVCFQPTASSPVNCQETVWAQIKREYYVRLHRRERDLASDEEFRNMIRELTEEVPINTENMLRANRHYLDHYIALGEEQRSSSWDSWD